MKTTDEIKAILAIRQIEAKDLFFVPDSLVQEKCGHEIRRRKSYVGLKKSDQHILDFVYDEVNIVNESMAWVRIEDCIALYDLCQHQMISNFVFKKVIASDDFLEFLSDSNVDHCWYEMSSRRLIRLNGYDMINTKPNQTEYIWAKKGEYFDCIERSSGKLICLQGGVIMVYDTNEGIFGRCGQYNVRYFDRYGVNQPTELRRIVMNAGGYLELQNHTFNIQHYIDVNGIILNL